MSLTSALRPAEARSWLVSEKSNCSSAGLKADTSQAKTLPAVAMRSAALRATATLATRILRSERREAEAVEVELPNISATRSSTWATTCSAMST